MDIQLFVVLALTFVIHLIGTLAYAFRIAGVRTGHIAIAFSLFNILVLVSRLSNAFQAPFLAKRVEEAIAVSATEHLARDFMWIIAAASLATVVGGLLIPTFQRLATRAVSRFHQQRSMGGLLRSAFGASGVAALHRSAALPRWPNLRPMMSTGELPRNVILINLFATALWTVGVLASIYAGILTPELRVTAASLSSLVNGVATIAMFVMVDPYLSAMTDDAASSRVPEGRLRRFIFWLVVSRFAGTVLAQVLLIPGAMLISTVAQII